MHNTVLENQKIALITMMLLTILMNQKNFTFFT